jgi:dTDP-4-dehydrorhamnose reductase
VQISTDYVFDGEKVGPYVEDDPTNPQSVYGHSKLAGERAAHDVSGAVVRTSWVCSAHGGNMVATIMRLAKEHPVMRFVSDQRGHPTFTTDLAAAVRQIGRDRFSGTLHVTNAGPVSWFEFAQAVLRAAGEDPSRVEPILTADLLPARPAQRPTNSVLSNQAYTDLGYEPLRDFRDPLGEVIGTYL